MTNITQLANIAQNFTVLYAEDDENTRSNILFILERIFKNIIVAKDGLEGIELAKKNKIDIIITDISMPKCDGLTMIQTIKQDYPNIPTILITGLEDSKTILKSIDIGINKYIVKPIQKDKLFLSLEDVVFLVESRQKHKKEQLILSKNLKMIAITKLIDNVSHQWRQYLNIISTSATGILLNCDAKVSDDGVQRLLNVIDTTVVQMDKELQDIFSEQQKEHKIENIKLDKVINDSLSYFSEKIDKNSIKIDIDIDDTNLFIHTDSLLQVFNHIFENSIDIFEQNNQIKPFIKIKSKIEKHSIIIDIIDNGGGIKESILQDIFEPYATTKHQYVGTGLGLYISYLLVTKSLNGKIYANNIIFKDQKCSNFTVVLPVYNI